ncbi:uncharacterized protein [Nicotiana sylvestris]|uniref:Uncharacterized protein LOC104221412 n=1 Tax=Nicotiana sylvestris TaxID=4096 RepID=A0A1U7W961_NICSY|nr:PREDICTED: uncharacterized protein LOC104221412 [Nicotiana sylvestris]
MEDLMKAFIIKKDERFETHGAIIRNFKRQVGQIVSLLSKRSPGTLHADTERNPKETINAMSLKNGKALQDPMVTQKDELTGNQVKTKEEKKNDEHHRSELRAEQEDGLKKKNKSEVPTGRRKTNKEVMARLKIVHVKLLSQMPVYAKFLKEILSNKWKVEETLVVKLTDHCSVILQNKFLQKCGDTDSFTIPYSLGSTKILKILCVIQTTIKPEEILEDVLVRVDKFVFPMDCIVVNMEENKEVPLILGKPFLAISRSLLDIQERQLMLRVGDERAMFKMKEAIGAPRHESIAHSEFKEKP